VPTPLALIGAILVTAQSPVQPQGDTPRVVLDAALKVHTGRLTGVNPTGVTIRDSAGRPETFAPGDAVAVLPALGVLGESSEPVPGSGVLLLVDGQVIPGRLGSSSGGGETVAWESEALGLIAAPLDMVSRIILRQGSPGVPLTTANDLVVLTNGDVVQGFVAHVNGGVGIERDGMISQVPAERVSEVILAGTVRPARGMWVWLTDGTAVEVLSLEVGADGVARCVPSLTPEREARRDAREVRAVVFDAARVRGLGALEARVVGSGGRRFTPPPKIGDVLRSPAWAPDIELPGPMEVEWALPPGASRLSLLVEMPVSSRVWGDCEVVVRTGNREVWRVRLNADTPSHEGVMEIDPGTPLRIAVEAGFRGGIQDRVVLRRPLVLIAP
jgi:hypothetical protein